MAQPLLSRFPRFVLATLLAAVLLFQGAEVRAQGTAPASGTPNEVYANTTDGTPLHWDVYPPEGEGPWPAILVIHGGGFKGGSLNSPTMEQCARDLAAAGFIAFVIEYRLAPPGSLPDQSSDGRYPQQSDDVRSAVLAARNDPRANHQVGVVGGSAGGYFAAYMAGSGTVGQDRIDVGVSPLGRL